MKFQSSSTVQVVLVEGSTDRYICSVDYVKSRKSYLIERNVFDVIKFCYEPRTKEEIKCFSLQSGAISENQFDNFFSEFLLKKGIIRDSSVKETLILSSPLLRIKLRLLSPVVVNFLVKPLAGLFSINAAVILALVFLTSLIHISVYIYNGDFSRQSAVLNWSDSITVIALIGAGLIFHELGHAAAAYKYGCRKVEIGVGWYIYFIVFYAELSEAWRLKPEKRLIIDCAGGYFQSIFGAVLWLVFIYTEQFVFMSAAALLALYSLFNLNPFFRMDGYWIASDLMRITNLRTTAFGVIKRLFTTPLQLIQDMRINHGSLQRTVFFYAMAMVLFYTWFSYYVYSSLFPTSLKVFYDVSNAALVNKFDLTELTISLAQLLWHGLIIYFVIYFSASMVKQIFEAIRAKYRV
ncbi:site-2 protease family protein [Rheinheimera sp. YQF-2]|uniref:Site-2 protease family protein n=1 Tax=Rheinheimera lutimaris TaxID=2740584 RepID=A0A7Y5EKJ0_9GAMM|nr:site-2 protease family protein [Rheinheimera lutimaris]NRQ44431.1 site-2 protease family protein [Rheinheimera lutimaris]